MKQLKKVLMVIGLCVSLFGCAQPNSEKGQQAVDDYQFNSNKILLTFKSAKNNTEKELDLTGDTLLYHCETSTDISVFTGIGLEKDIKLIKDFLKTWETKDVNAELTVLFPASVHTQSYIYDLKNDSTVNIEYIKIKFYLLPSSPNPATGKLDGKCLAASLETKYGSMHGLSYLSLMYLNEENKPTCYSINTEKLMLEAFVNRK